MPPLVDLTGQQFGRLIVVGQSRDVAGRVTWQCQCDCGATVTVAGTSLKGGLTKSCGCIRRETTAAKNFRHGHRRTKLYHVWSAIKGRCLNPTDHAFPHYGGRGITICNEWRDSYPAFHDWVMSNLGPRQGTQELDRIDNERGYEPGNLRWADRQQQVRNRRVVRLSPETVRQVKEMRQQGLTYPAIAKALDIAPSTARAVVTGQTWADVA